VVAVSGGSLGSRRINQATLDLARLWSGRHDVAIRHVVGRRDWDELRSATLPSGPLVYQRVPYEEDMASLYAAADVAVQRAGANTVAELALAGVPAVLVPLPGSPGDHQGANARGMAGAGGAVVVVDADLDGARLARQLDALFAEPDRLAAMGQAAKARGRPDAAAAVARLVEQHARAARGEEGNAGAS
jgi:UDP-N-acetylglucosamine--N-acetylmuramyl-(pentapeptide) pyrophosphoryl-undecaprenol N-acetylglucosamine transferase